MEKLIKLKSARIGYGRAGTGFIAALIALASGLNAVIAPRILSGASALGSVAEGIASVLFREAGVRDG